MTGFLKQFNKKHQHHRSLPTDSTVASSTVSNVIYSPPPPLDRSLSDTSTPSDHIPRSGNFATPTAHGVDVATSPTKSAGLALKNWFADWSPRKSNANKHFSYDRPGIQRISSGTSSHSSHSIGTSRSRESVFDTSLQRSMEIAKCEIVLNGAFGDRKFGFVPVVVAKCGSIIKQHGLSTSGLFRIGGNKKRIDHLAYEVFTREPFYGLNFEYEAPSTPGERAKYTIHDFASLLKGYLNRLTEPVVPYSLFEEFVHVIPEYDARTSKYYDIIENPTSTEGDIAAAKESLHPSAKTIKDIAHKFHDVMLAMPWENRDLLVYILDLLHMVQKRSATNLMTAQNLAIVFQPSLLSPEDLTTDMDAHRLARHSLHFLIENFDELADDHLFEGSA